MYFIVKIMVYKWELVMQSEPGWVCKLGMAALKLENLNVVLSTHSQDSDKSQRQKETRLFLKFLRQSLKDSKRSPRNSKSNKYTLQNPLKNTHHNQQLQHTHTQTNNQSNPPNQTLIHSPNEHQLQHQEQQSILNHKSHSNENQSIANVYIEIFRKFRVSCIDSLIDLWKEELWSVHNLSNFHHNRLVLLEYLMFSPTLAKIAEMTLVLELPLFDLFAAVTNSKNFVAIQEFYDPDYNNSSNWFTSLFKRKTSVPPGKSDFQINFQEAALLSYVFCVLRRMSLEPDKVKQIVVSKKVLRKAWMLLIGCSF